jgi:hypothetical protein
MTGLSRPARSASTLTAAREYAPKGHVSEFVASNPLDSCCWADINVQVYAVTLKTPRSTVCQLLDRLYTSVLVARM